ncbi:MAG: hypothetical protein M0Z77_00670 [Thermoplasmatales archaeon]|jgi:hypothetical protein|nr:hypothetical protein [Thermoplasmatales archaeon]
MVSEGQLAWSKFLDDIKDVKGWPYPEPFQHVMELFRQATLCYDNNSFDACVVLGRAIIDGAIFDAMINPPIPETGSYICVHCGGTVEGGLNGLQIHEYIKHTTTKQWWEERDKFLNETLGRKLKEFSKHKEYTDYTDTWDDFDKKNDNRKKIGLLNQATLSGLLECDELDDINENIRKKTAVRLHRIAMYDAYAKWQRDNAEKMRLLADKKIEVDQIEWFSWGQADGPEAKKVLGKTGTYLTRIIKKYGGIWK